MIPLPRWIRDQLFLGAAFALVAGLVALVRWLV